MAITPHRRASQPCHRAATSVRRRNVVLALLAVTAPLVFVGCNPTAETDAQPAPQPLAGVALRLLVVGDDRLADAAALLQGEWKGETAATFEVEQMSEAELLAAAPIDADAVIYPAGQLGALVESGRIAMLDPGVLAEPPGEWDDVFERLRSRDGSWGGKPYGVPFGSPVFVCMVRADLLRQLKQRPPTTWQEYRELARLLADRDRLGDAAPPSDTEWFAAAEPLAPGWAGITLLARAATYAKHSDHYSCLFQMDTMEPLVATPPFVRALEELVDTAGGTSSAPPSPQLLDPDGVRQAFFEGRCGLAITWPASPRTTDEAASSTAPIDVGFAELPGSRDVYNPGTTDWERRRENATTTVTLLGVDGRMGSIASGSEQPEAAARLLMWLSGSKWGPRVAAASASTTLYRRSQVASPVDWLPESVSPDQAVAYAEAVERGISRSEVVFAVRLPGRERYLGALDEAVATCLAGKATAAEALEEAAGDWRAITAELGLDAQRLAYQRGLGLAR